ncbi:hypothetical protein B0H67DRAFT_184695 [Lasiosphaeris hirsuta]|uniref:Uncharacterized protein n=1 Tax=Lasiosphaeris hirsuta TaxID=260670 RepID=A0AA40DYH2_9PEZI|nr:hypothetical protein B0H67DRAFT_184695 [Lasiosphaeris hirsuta]
MGLYWAISGPATISTEMVHQRLRPSHRRSKLQGPPQRFPSASCAGYSNTCGRCVRAASTDLGALKVLGHGGAPLQPHPSPKSKYTILWRLHIPTHSFLSPSLQPRTIFFVPFQPHPYLPVFTQCRLRTFRQSPPVYLPLDAPHVAQSQRVVHQPHDDGSPISALRTSVVSVQISTSKNTGPCSSFARRSSSSHSTRKISAFE